jgi:hypothetical protein
MPGKQDMDGRDEPGHDECVECYAKKQSPRHAAGFRILVQEFIVQA